MTTNASAKTDYFEVVFQACLNWKRDGCSPARDLNYWLGAGRQTREPGRLPARSVKSESGIIHVKSNGAWKASASLASARSI